MKRICASLLLGLALVHVIGEKPPAAFTGAPAIPADSGFSRPRTHEHAVMVAKTVPVPFSVRPATSALSQENLLSWARRDPAAAGAWLRLRPDDIVRQQALATVIRTWLRFDPRAAADFALALPDAPARARALEQVAGAWVAQDPVAASIWAESLPALPELDTFAAALATIPELIFSQLDTSLSWAEVITSEELRMQTLGIILERRSAAGPEDSNIYLVTTPRAAPARKTLLASVR